MERGVRIEMGKSKGFTLVEIMVVVVIIGLLSAIALPSFSKARKQSQFVVLLNELRIFGDAVELYIFEQGAFPEDSRTGDIPAGLEGYISVSSWADGSSIGGSWDVEQNDSGVTSAVGVVGYTISDEELLEFDSIHDDGSLTTGDFRVIASGRYYRIIAD